MSSRYWTFTLIGLVVCGASIVAFDWGLYHLVRTGTCGSTEGGISAPPCPPGTGGHILALMAGVFAGLAGIALYAARGEGGRSSPVGLGLIMWMLLFVGIAGAVGVAAFGPAAGDDSSGTEALAIIFAIVFIPMGVLPLLFPLLGRGKRARALELVQHGSRCPGVVVSVEDTNVTINDNPRVKLTVRAEPPGESPFTIVKHTTVSRVNIPRQGDRCTVFYDPTNREGKNGITFDSVPAGFAMPVATGGVSAGTPAPASPIPGFSQQPPSAPAPPAAEPIPGFSSPANVGGGGEPDDDALEKIEKLGKLRERGLVTQAEFDEQKRRLLGEL